MCSASRQGSEWERTSRDLTIVSLIHVLHPEADFTVLTADEASSIALEFDLIPIVDDDKAFDIFPEYVVPC